MARLNVKGNRIMGDICEMLDVPFSRIGSHVVAFSDEDMQTLRELYDRGTKNGVPDMKLLNKAEVHEMEPNLSDDIVGSLYAPSAGIISPWELTLAMIETAVRNGARLMLETPVDDIEKTDNGYSVKTPNGTFETKYIINAAGLHAGDIQQMAGEKEFEIQPSRGEYFLLDKSEGTRVSSTIFQCPNKNGKGVLVSPTVGGNLIVGPDAVNVSDPDNTKNTAEGLKFVRETSQKSVPSISFRDNIRNFTGVRANHSKDDFLIYESPSSGMFNLAGIKSPGLSAAPAIALEAVKYVKSKKDIKLKDSFCDSRRRIKFKNLSAEEKAEVIKKDPLFGRIICRCETITEGEIVAAIHSPVPPTTINGVKRRAGAGMGRCQGGFCAPRVQEILSRELGIPMEKIMMENPNSYILTGKTKEAR